MIACRDITKFIIIIMYTNSSCITRHILLSLSMSVSLSVQSHCVRGESVYVCGIVCDFSSDRQCMSIIITPTHTLSLSLMYHQCALYLRAASSLISRYLSNLLTFLTTVTTSTATALLEVISYLQPNKQTSHPQH